MFGQKVKSCLFVLAENIQFGLPWVLERLLWSNWNYFRTTEISF